MACLRALSIVLVLTGILGTSGCVGVTGNASGGGGTPGGGGGTPALDVSPSTLNFGTVTIGKTSTQTVKLSNTGTTDITITKISISGAGFTFSGIALPLTLTAGSSTTFTVVFGPNKAGTGSGNIWISSTADASAAVVSMNASGMPTSGGAPAIDVIPSPINFGDVTVGSTDSQTMRISNTGSADLTVSKVSISGSGFSFSGISLPLTLSAGKDSTFTATFKPTAANSSSGSIMIVSNAPGSPLAISMSATGVTTTPQLTASPTSVNFGSVTIGSTKSQNVKLTNTGNTNIAITTASVAGTSFSVSGGSNVTLTPNQSATVTVEFDPTSTASVTATLSVSSNAPNSPLHIGLSGQGAAQAVQHSVVLNWTPSSSTVIGYFIYRGVVSGGPYSRLNSPADPNGSYTDGAVSSGKTYFYVVTAVDSTNIESAYSNQVSASIP